MARATPKGSKQAKHSATVTPKGKGLLGAATLLQTMMRQIENSPIDDAVNEAQQVAFDAMEAPSRAKRVALAKKALAISPHCADALGILADDEEDDDKSFPLYEQAVAAGAVALGADFIEENRGHFWGLIETRPYMRALESLAAAAWRRGLRERSCEILEECLSLNPNDNQGIRYGLMDTYLVMGRLSQAQALMATYKNDGSAAWAWSKALIMFLREGDSALARQALKAAMSNNRHVAAYVTLAKGLPKRMPDYYAPGEDSEAAVYADDSKEVWEHYAGARDWVAASVKSRNDLKPGSQEGPVRSQNDNFDENKVDEAVLALLTLSLHDGVRAWKGFDWEALDRLHKKGLIDDPKNKNKSVAFTREGLAAAEAAFARLFARP